MAIDSKRKGKAGGARVITYTTLVNENTGEVWLIGYVFIDTLRRIPAKILLAVMPAGFCVFWMQQHIHRSQKNKLKKKLKSLIQLKNPKNFGSYNILYYICTHIIKM